MQSFLPYASFAESASVLDYRRLGKQRMECKQMLAALGYAIVAGRLIHREPAQGYKNHPCTLMWKGYEMALAFYGSICIYEWMNRGYNNTMEFMDPCEPRVYTVPDWIGDEAIHSSHRSKLMQKAPEHYEQFGWDDPLDMRYWWPIRQPDGSYTLGHRGNG